jgi:cytochrome c peroxidase
MRFIVGLLLLIAFGVCAATAGLLVSPVPLSNWFSDPAASFTLAQGENPNPVQLVRPTAAPLSAMALLGKQIFYDTSLSSSGRLACASCHSAAHAYGPVSDLSVVYGGPNLTRQGARAVPSLMYLDVQPNFSIGPDSTAGDTEVAPVLTVPAANAPRVTKTAQDNAQTAANLVPQGGMFWDGRANTLQQQAMGPLLNPLEMDGGSLEQVAAKLRAAPYASTFTQFFGPAILKEPGLLVSEALYAVARYQVEDPSFHPYSSKYDYWLEGKARLTAAEMHGYMLFNDPAKADCGGCHLDQPGAGNQPPLFTDHQFEALGVPRNPDIAFNQNPAYFDLGLCGPYRTDMAQQTQYCGLFLTPTLRNVATRQVFFHNGEYHTLQQVLDFYDFRDTNPEKIYPVVNGKAQKFNDIPAPYQANVDIVDPPFNRNQGDTPAMSAQDEADIIAFLNTLTDGYTPP